MVNEDELGKLLAKRRESLGLSSRQAAALVGCSSSTISRLETGGQVPAPELLQRLSASFGLDLRELFILAGYPLPEAMPELRPYLRMKFKDLPPSAFREIESFVEFLRTKYGVKPTGPSERSDERAEGGHDSEFEL
jgi:transcriptional regulator with XRE-family HTH domain